MNTIPHILIVDDEERIRFILQRTLRHEGYKIDVAADGRQAQTRLEETQYDLMLLDLHMEPVPGMDVFNTARRLQPDLVVIILTAYGSLKTSVAALRLDAFDYLAKPADPLEIRRRIRAGIAYRCRQEQQQRILNHTFRLQEMMNEMNQMLPPMDDRPTTCYQSEGLVMDEEQHTAVWHGEELALTTAEFGVLFALLQNAPQPLSPVEIVRQALGYEADLPEAREIVKWHIHNLRHKVEAGDGRPQHIKTIRHKGYLWSGESARPCVMVD